MDAATVKDRYGAAQTVCLPAKNVWRACKMYSHNQDALIYFAQIQDPETDDGFYSRPEVWDERARAWETE